MKCRDDETALKRLRRIEKYGCLTFAMIFQLYEILGNQKGGANFVAVLICCAGLVALFCAAHIRSLFQRWVYASLFALSGWFFSGYRLSMDAHMTFDVFKTMFGYRSFAGLAIAQYGPSIIFSFFLSLPILFGIGLRPSENSTFRFAATIPPFFLIALTGFQAFVGDRKDYPIVGVYAPQVFTILMTRDALSTSESPKRQPVSIAHTKVKPTQDLVLIIDESISPLYLDINDPRGVYSGLGRDRVGFSIANFGVASAITHCTNATNRTLRHGGTRDNYRHLNEHGPSLFAFAKGAGFETVYIDAQTTGGQLHNAMDQAERALIDRFIQFDAVPPLNRDQAAAEKLRDLMNDGDFQFILVNKQGAHFPVNASYPANRRIYHPVAPQTQSFSPEEWYPLYAFTAAHKNWRHYRNAYRNTVVWNVGGFFDRLLVTPLADPATIIYTSDHGQDLHERGNRGTNTHCAPWPYPEEGAVPLVVIDNNPVSSEWRKLAERERNAKSHYQLFPTLLNLMGFDQSAVERRYGPMLKEVAADPMTFNILFHARSGHDPLWQHLDAKALRRPPAGD